MYTINFAIFCQKCVPNIPKYGYRQKILKSVQKMAELRAFYVNPSKIPDEPLEVVFAHCVTLLTEISCKLHENLFNQIF